MPKCAGSDVMRRRAENEESSVMTSSRRMMRGWSAVAQLNRTHLLAMVVEVVDSGSSGFICPCTKQRHD